METRTFSEIINDSKPVLVDFSAFNTDAIFVIIFAFYLLVFVLPGSFLNALIASAPITPP